MSELNTVEIDPATSYTAATSELDQIVVALEAGNGDVDAVVAMVARASALVEFCRDKVNAAQMQVKDITEKATEAAAAA